MPEPTTQVLFVGNFLGDSVGTEAVSRTTARLLSADLSTAVVSTRPNRVLRLLDIVAAVATTRAPVVHIDTFSGQAFWIARVAGGLARLRGRRVILNLHGGMLPEYRDRHPRRVDKALARADRVISPSSRLADHFTGLGTEVQHLPNHVAVDRFTFRPREPFGARLLWVRAFSPVYHPALAVEVIARLVERHPEVTLTMVGPDKGLLAETRARSRSLGVAHRVRFTGAVAHEDLPAVFHEHDVLLNTTRFESFGMAVVEAAATGTPVVSVAVGELPRLWTHGEDILLVDDRDAAAMAAEVGRILNDPDLRRRIIEGGRQNADRFGWARLRGRWLDLLAGCGAS